MANIRQRLKHFFRPFNRNYKDALFRRCFADKRDLLDLYNALNDTSYTDIDALEITTLEDCIYMTYKNDLSFMIFTTLNLYEHQSTYNPNMPIRGLIYFAKLYEAYIKKQELNLYQKTLVKLPTPRYIVFYNGTDNQPDLKKLRLSDAFGHDASGQEPALECIATMLNINYGHNQTLLNQCKRLHDYSLFIATIRQNLNNGYSPRTAVRMAMDQCIQNHVLEDILLKQKSEVFNMLLSEFDLKKYIRSEREDARREEHEKMLFIIQNYEKDLAETKSSLAEKDSIMTQQQMEIEQLRAEVHRLKKDKD